MEFLTPAHYAGIQPLDVMKINFTKEQHEGFLAGNALKYIMRYSKKNGLEDLEKCMHYCQLLYDLKTEKN
jgi:hypothetical protein